MGCIIDILFTRIYGKPKDATTARQRSAPPLVQWLHAKDSEMERRIIN